MLRLRIHSLLLPALLLCNLHSFGWGAFGHRLVADIAKVYCNKAVLDSVNKYLGDGSWGDAAVWMDEIRSDHFYDRLKQMHYINIDEGKLYEKTNEDNIINELEYVTDQLKHRDGMRKDDVLMNLRILFHLMGDLHQPLHVGYGKDKGGNDIQVSFNGNATNLHRLWDSELLESRTTAKSEIVEMSKHLTNAEIAEAQIPNLTDWLNDSRSKLPSVYNFQNDRITPEYATQNIPVIEHQLLFGGIRLSGMLNSIFLDRTHTEFVKPQNKTAEKPVLPEPKTNTGTVAADSAKFHIGEQTTVCGKVMGVYTGKSGVVKLNFGADYPNNTFTAVIFENDVKKFKPAAEFKGQTICVNGNIELYNGKPEIVLHDPLQVK